MPIYSWMKESGACQDWISCLQQGDEKALEHFYGEHNRGLYNFIHGIVNNDADTEDIVQDSFITIWELRETIHSELHFRNRLYKIAGRRSIDCLRRRNKESLLQSELLHLSAEGESLLEITRIQNIALEQLAHYIDELPPGCREVFKNWYYHKRTTHEIAQQLQIDPQTVLNQKNKAIRILKDLFFKQELSVFIFFFISFLGC